METAEAKTVAVEETEEEITEFEPGTTPSRHPTKCA